VSRDLSQWAENEWDDESEGLFGGTMKKGADKSPPIAGGTPAKKPTKAKKTISANKKKVPLPIEEKSPSKVPIKIQS